MAASLQQLLLEFESLWPVSGAEAWDAPGLIAGSSQDRISRVLLTVDVTSEVVEEAIDGGFDLVLAHHPFIMRGVSSVSSDTAKGSTLSRAIRSNVAIYAAHTNADIVENGVSDTLAKSIGLSNIEPLVSDGTSVGHGRVGLLPDVISLGDFARIVAGVLPSTASGVRVAGDYEQPVRKIALCAGAGDSFIGRAVDEGADVYLTSDLRHHVVQDVRESAILGAGSPAIIDVSHWAAEWLWLEVAASQLAAKFSEIQFLVSHIRTDPWDFVVTQ
jgi:dinuclear metal center YbgI/SA1388 family protein